MSPAERIAYLQNQVECLGCAVENLITAIDIMTRIIHDKAKGDEKTLRAAEKLTRELRAMAGVCE